MSKFVILTDLHFGVRGEIKEFHDNMKKFYEDVFFPYLKAGHRIDGVIIAGDVFDNRRKIDTLTASRTKEYFFRPLHNYLAQNNLVCNIIAGNHDVYHRDNLDTNTLNEFIVNQVYNEDLQAQPFIIHTDVFEMPTADIILVPWMTKNNKEDFQKQILRSKKSTLIGHLELSGFNFSKVQVAMHGDDPKSFEKFKTVLSGHYHYKHTKGNITYLGSPTEQTWIDVDTKRGFHVFDDETHELTFIENPYNIFENINIGEEPRGDHPRYYRVRRGDEEQSTVDSYTKMLYDKFNALNVEYRTDVKAKNNIQESTETIGDIEDTPTFIRNNIEDEEIASILIDLYNRAQAEV